MTLFNLNYFLIPNIATLVFRVAAYELGGGTRIQSITLALSQVIQKLIAVVGMLQVIFPGKQTLKQSL